MTAQDLLGALIRWTGLTIVVYGVFILFASGFGLIVIGLGAASFFFADEIVELAYWRRRLAQRSPPASEPPA
jgi:hypothetical protein